MNGQSAWSKKAKCGALLVVVALVALPIWAQASSTPVSTPAPVVEYKYNIPMDRVGDIGDMYLDWRRDELYVLDSPRRKVMVMDLEGMQIFDFNVTSREPELEPRAIVVDRRGTIYVLQFHWRKQVIEKYNPRGVLSGQFELTGHAEMADTRLTGLGIDRKENLWVIDTGAARVMAFAPDGSFIRQVTTKGKEFSKVASSSKFAAVMFDKRNRLHLLDSGISSVFVYRYDGKFQRKYGRRGQVVGTLGRGAGLDIGRTGLAYVCDTVHHMVNVYNQQGKFVGEFGGQGAGPGRFYFPKLIATDRKGKIFVIDSLKSHGIQVFEEIARKKPTPQPVE